MWDLFNTNNDENLNQGQLMLDRKNKLLKRGKKHMELLEQTTSSNLGSIIEPLTGISNNETSISTLENEFNTTLVKYTTAYKLLMNEILTNSNNPIIEKYGGKNVKLDENIYYVNNYGVRHGYSKDAWISKPSSCSNDYIKINKNDFDLLIPGANMGLGQACDIAGYNVQDKSSSERSWIDIKGVKHKYSDDIWENRSPSCQGSPKSLKSTAYLNIPEDSSNPPITKDFYCNKLNVNVEHLKNLSTLNARLLVLSKQLLKDIMTLATTDENLKIKLRDLGEKVTKQMNNLEGDKKEFDNALSNNSKSLIGKDYMNNISGIKQNSEYKLSSNYLQYILWLFIVVFLIFYTLYSFSSSTPSFISIGIILLVIISIIYYFGSYIKNILF